MILVIGLIIGVLFCYFILRPKIKVTNQINEEIQRENDKITELNHILNE